MSVTWKSGLGQVCSPIKQKGHISSVLWLFIKSERKKPEQSCTLSRLVFESCNWLFYILFNVTCLNTLLELSLAEKQWQRLLVLFKIKMDAA